MYKLCISNNKKKPYVQIDIIYFHWDIVFSSVSDKSGPEY